MLARVPRPKPLTLEEVRVALVGLPGFSLVEGSLRSSFEFESFGDAFGWMTRVALVAERLDHHPEWTNAYRRVDVVLRTHDVDALTALDVELAAAMNRAAGR